MINSMIQTQRQLLPRKNLAKKKEQDRRRKAEAEQRRQTERQERTERHFLLTMEQVNKGMAVTELIIRNEREKSLERMPALIPLFWAKQAIRDLVSYFRWSHSPR